MWQECGDGDQEQEDGLTNNERQCLSESGDLKEPGLNQEGWNCRFSLLSCCLSCRKYYLLISGVQTCKRIRLFEVEDRNPESLQPSLRVHFFLLLPPLPLLPIALEGNLRSRLHIMLSSFLLVFTRCSISGSLRTLPLQGGVMLLNPFHLMALEAETQKG